MKTSPSKSFQTITFSLIVVVLGTTSAQNFNCPFEFMYILGDGFTDTGNAVKFLAYGPQLLATRFPYGITYPGHPSGRWSDGRNVADYMGTTMCTYIYIRVCVA